MKRRGETDLLADAVLGASSAKASHSKHAVFPKPLQSLCCCCGLDMSAELLLQARQLVQVAVNGH